MAKRKEISAVLLVGHDDIRVKLGIENIPDVPNVVITPHLVRVENNFNKCHSFFCSKWKLRSKFSKKSKFWSKIEILNQNLSFVQRSNVLSTIEVLVKKIKILAQNRSFCQKSKF